MQYNEKCIIFSLTICTIKFGFTIDFFLILIYTICMKTKYKYARTCVYDIKYRITWCTKRKRKVLSENVEEVLKKIIKETEEKQMFEIESCEVIDKSIVVCIVNSIPKTAPSEIASLLKSVSGRKLTLMFPEIKEEKTQKKLWNKNYLVETIKTIDDNEWEAYILKEKED